MPVTFGTAGAYVRKLQARRHGKRLWLLYPPLLGAPFIVALCIHGVAHPGWWGASISLALGLAMWQYEARTDKVAQRLWHGERCAKQGAEGEERVEEILSKLPDDHVVIHDVLARYGNIDHIVVAPHGVFAIETKSHHGRLSVEDGRLLLNGRPPFKDAVGQTRRNAMWLKDRLRERTGLTVYVHGLLVFTRGFTAKPLPEIGGVQVLAAHSLLRTIARPRRTAIPVDRVTAALLPQLAGPAPSDARPAEASVSSPPGE